MLNENSIIISLDIGSAKTTACAGSIDELGRIEIHDVSMVKTRGIERGVVVDIGEAAGCVEDIVKKLENKLHNCEQARLSQIKRNIKINSVFAAVSGDHILGNNVKGMLTLSNQPIEIDRKVRERVIDSAKFLSTSIDREILHALAQEFTVDGYKRIKDPIGIYGTKIGVQLHVISAGASFVTNLIKVINRAGLDVEGLGYSGLAAGYPVLNEQDKQLGVILLELGAGLVNILFFSEGNLQYTNVISIGGNDITMEISRRFGIDFAQAERLKMQYKSLSSDYIDKNSESEDKIIIKKDASNYESITRSQLADIIDEKLKELLGLAKKDLELAGIIPRAHAGVVICGGMSFLDGIIEKVEETMKLPVTLGIMRGFVSSIPGLSNIFYSAGIGLVMQTLKEQSQERPDKYVPAGVMGRVISKVKTVYEEYF